VSWRTINKEHRWWGVLPGPQAIPHVVLLRVRVHKKEPRKYSERGRPSRTYAYMLVISVRELWLPPSRGSHIYTFIHVYIVPSARIRAVQAVSTCIPRWRWPRIYIYEVTRCEARREKTEKNSERRKARGKKIVRAITHPLDTWESGIPLASQTSFLSLSSRFFTRNKLISFLQLKKNLLDVTPCLGVRNVE